jgi:hypothetical protein
MQLSLVLLVAIFTEQNNLSFLNNTGGRLNLERFIQKKNHLRIPNFK